MEFLARITPDRHLKFGQRDLAYFERFMAEHPGMLLKISPVLPESGKQRRFFEGAFVPLVTFYQEGMDHRNQDDLRRVREWLKEEFNGEFVSIGGVAHRVAKSTKGREVLQPFMERVIIWLVENYQPPQEALDPQSFKVWHETVFPSGGPDNYIDYLVATGKLIHGGVG
jgi:hypothetical protein